MAEFGSVWPGLIVALAEGLRDRSKARERRPGRLADLEALAGRRRGDDPGEIVLTDGWTGPGRMN